MGDSKVASDLLTERHREIVQLAAEGRGDAEIANKLGISLHTVQSHWKKIREIFNANSRGAIIASIVSEAQNRRSDAADDRNQYLLLQIAENRKLVEQLEEANRKLEEVVKENQRLLSDQMSATAKFRNQQGKRLEHLEHLNTLLRDQQVVIHEGEYGGAWRKTFMSESVEFAGFKNTQWTDGEVTIYDVMRPEDTAHALKCLENMDGKNERCIIAYRAKDGNDQPLLLIDFIRMDPFDETGVGHYVAYTFNCNEWIDELKQLVESGWPHEWTPAAPLTTEEEKA